VTKRSSTDRFLVPNKSRAASRFGRNWRQLERGSGCENASNHDPTAKVIQSIDFVRKDEILTGSFFARNASKGIVTPLRACGPAGGLVAKGMKKISYRGYRFPPEIIHQALSHYQIEHVRNLPHFGFMPLQRLHATFAGPMP
jgi:hypothetical protein